MAAIAPMDLVKADTDSSSIPLKCVLCPKKPTFSDVSHLLTHISSKSHLSNRFKTEILAKTEPGSRNLLDQYEAWYQRYRVDQLISERMAAKDQKKHGKRGRVQTTTKPYSALALGTNIKTDPEEDRGSYGPRLHLWPANQPGSYQTPIQSLYFDNSPYSTPILRPHATWGHPESPVNLIRPKSQISRSETETTESLLASEGTTTAEAMEGESEATKLKGIYWPGMSLFDAAPEEQRKKRNQKKDESVLMQMKLNSASIQPTEVIWTAEGDFERSRDIYATPSPEGSPVLKPDDAEAHKKKRVRRVSKKDLGGDEDDGLELPPPRMTLRSTRSRARRAMAAALTAVDPAVKPQPEEDAEDDPAIEDDIPDEGADDDEDTEIRVPSHSHGPHDAYDVFQDASEHNMGESPQSPSDPSATVDDAEKNEGRPGAMVDGNRFDLRRPALQRINPNAGLVSPTRRSIKQPVMPFFPSGPSGHGNFLTHSPSQPSTYFPGATGGGNPNPLSLQSQRSSYPYHSYTMPQAVSDMKSESPGFQAINSLNGMPYNAFSLPGNHGYNSTNGYRDTSEYDL